MEIWWSSGLRRVNRDLCITRFDCRPQFMWFEFDVRTADNVELVIECTFFYEVVDLPQMIRTTGNLPGDIYNQARSQFIKEVATVTLKSFMEEMHSISSRVLVVDPNFYTVRGVNVHSLHVTRYFCTEERTSEVLQQIIEETTNRMNRLSKAESESEIKLFQLRGQIDEERLNSDLLKIQYEHRTAEACVAGGAEAERIAAFLAGLDDKVPELENRISMWQTLRKTEALSVVSTGNANLYFTPSDVNLSIESKR
eukprot:NODE_14475_length_1107_cov_2.295918.p1 GENE.NODE_14475_length_1107_cov_2.295918~~NODE_14475_length_1107_cov_2.295918.p1  ORF type:complete len:293 (-),score=102.95 NODE_14475_length_1107_cov_2.295918:229-990(-)